MRVPAHGGRTREPEGKSERQKHSHTDEKNTLPPELSKLGTFNIRTLILGTVHVIHGSKEEKH